jgi:hypothetical protein
VLRAVAAILLIAFLLLLIPGVVQGLALLLGLDR